MHKKKAIAISTFSKLNIIDLSEARFAREYTIKKQADKKRIFYVDRECFGFVTMRFCQHHPSVSARLQDQQRQAYILRHNYPIGHDSPMRGNSRPYCIVNYIFKNPEI